MRILSKRTFSDTYPWMGMYVTTVNLQAQFLCELLGSNILKNLKSNPGQNHRTRENGNWLHTPREWRCAVPSKFFCVMRLPKLAFNSGCVTRIQFTNKKVSRALVGSVANATVKGDTDKGQCVQRRGKLYRIGKLRLEKKRLIGMC